MVEADTGAAVGTAPYRAGGRIRCRHCCCTFQAIHDGPMLPGAWRFLGQGPVIHALRARWISKSASSRNTTVEQRTSVPAGVSMGVTSSSSRLGEGIVRVGRYTPPGRRQGRQSSRLGSSWIGEPQPAGGEQAARDHVSRPVHAEVHAAGTHRGPRQRRCRVPRAARTSSPGACTSRESGDGGVLRLSSSWARCGITGAHAPSSRPLPRPHPGSRHRRPDRRSLPADNSTDADMVLPPPNWSTGPIGLPASMRTRRACGGAHRRRPRPPL